VKPLGIHIYIWFLVILYVIFYILMNQTRFGRRVYAVGSNAEATSLSGVSAPKIVMAVYTISGAIAGFCGPLWAGRYSFAQGDSAMGFEMFVIAACVIGGVSVNGGIGTVMGVFFGAILIGVIKNALPMLMISTFWQNALQGAIILAAVIVNVLVIRRSQKRVLLERAAARESKRGPAASPQS
jgi:rhamnose transport system permease protein